VRSASYPVGRGPGGPTGRQADGVAITLSGRCIMRAARPRAGRRRVRAARAPFAPAADAGAATAVGVTGEGGAQPATSVTTWAGGLCRRPFFLYHPRRGALAELV
jgi:hypothetical protein